MKFNSQICTTTEQSERLLTLGLKKETADMVYKPHCHYPDEVINYCEPTPMVEPLRKYIIADDIDFRYYIPAWSLHRLIELAEVSVEVSGIWVRISGAYRYEEKDNAYDNLIDAIADLINNDVFNKEYLEELCGKH